MIHITELTQVTLDGKITKVPKEVLGDLRSNIKSLFTTPYSICKATIIVQHGQFLQPAADPH